MEVFRNNLLKTIIIFCLIIAFGMAYSIQIQSQTEKLDVRDFEDICLENSEDDSECADYIIAYEDGCELGDLNNYNYDRVPACHVLSVGGQNYYCSYATGDLFVFRTPADLGTQLSMAVRNNPARTYANSENDGVDQDYCESEENNFPLSFQVNESGATAFPPNVSQIPFLQSEAIIDEPVVDSDECIDNLDFSGIGSFNATGGIIDLSIDGLIECTNAWGRVIAFQFNFTEKDVSIRSDRYQITIPNDGDVDTGLQISLSNNQINELEISDGSTKDVFVEVLGENINIEGSTISVTFNEEEDGEAGGSSEEREPTVGDPVLSTNGADACLQTGGSVSAENVEACLNCVGNGGIYIAIGCVDPTPLGITTRLIQIALGTMGGVALVQMIVAGIQYQTGDEEKIAEARKKILTTIGGIALLIFSVLLLQILGVDILDILPSGSI